jgi:hypothetical protein
MINVLDFLEQAYILRLKVPEGDQNYTEVHRPKQNNNHDVFDDELTGDGRKGDGSDCS